MFGLTYTEEVTIRRAVQGSLGVAGRSQYAQVLHEDDETAVRLVCKIQERGRITIDSNKRQIKTDATLLYSPAGVSVLQDSDIVVRNGHIAYEVVGIETLNGQWGTPAGCRVDLVKTALPVLEDRHGS